MGENLSSYLNCSIVALSPLSRERFNALSPENFLQTRY